MSKKERADVEDNFRRTVGQALGGAAVLIGAAFALYQFLQQQKTTQEQQKAAHDLLISNQVSKGFEQLAGDKLAMRLGGIYALEGVMNDPSGQYHRSVLEALCAFVRENTIGKTVPDKPTTDVQATLTVIGRRAAGPGEVDLAKVSIPSADLTRANLTRAPGGSSSGQRDPAGVRACIRNPPQHRILSACGAVAGECALWSALPQGRRAT
jgi:hypothetical protein